MMLLFTMLPVSSYEEMAELEWLSNFVEEDSFSSEDLEKLHLISGMKAGGRPPADRGGAAKGSCQMAAQGKQARTKRPRGDALPGICAWSDSSRRLIFSPPEIAATAPPCESELLVPVKPPAKKKRRIAGDGEPPAAVMAAADGRRCQHCLTDKTPQWRTGPMGPKTLCNACGVRFKAGRLVPEYRPAASPTFVLSMHSNSHRKVLEIRRQKGVEEKQQQQLLHVVDHFPPPSGIVGISYHTGDGFLVDHHHHHHNIW